MDSDTRRRPQSINTIEEEQDARGDAVDKHRWRGRLQERSFLINQARKEEKEREEKANAEESSPIAKRNLVREKFGHSVKKMSSIMAMSPSPKKLSAVSPTRERLSPLNFLGGRGQWDVRARNFQMLPKKKLEADEDVDQLTVYRVGAKINDASRYARLSKVEFFNFSGNDLSTIQPFQYLFNLRVLNVSNNMIQFLPDANFWGRLELLAYLTLDKNRIGKFSALSGLVDHPALRILSLKNTPFSGTPLYRTTVVTRIETIVALDGMLVTDEDMMSVKGGSSMELHLLRYKKKREWRVPEALRHQEGSSVGSLRAAFRAELDSWHALNSYRRPSVMIQRAMRGHRGRLMFEERRRLILPSVVEIQRWLLRCWFRRVAKAALLAAELQGGLHGSALCRRCIGELRDDALPEGQEYSDNRLYFLASDAPSLIALLDVAAPLFPRAQAPQPHLSRVLQLSEQGRHDFLRASSSKSTPASQSPVMTPITVKVHKKSSEEIALSRLASANSSAVAKTPFVSRFVARIHHSDRSQAEAAAVVGWQEMHRSGPDQRRRGLNLVRRRGCHVTTREMDHFTAGWFERSKDIERMKRMVVVTCGSHRSKRLLLSLIALVNQSETGSRRLCMVLPSALRRICAATRIQAAMRAYVSLTRIHPPMFSAVLAHRAVRCIQSWWRFRLLGYRMRALERTYELVREVQGTSLYMFAQKLEERVGLAISMAPFLRTSRIGAGINHEGKVTLVGKMDEQSVKRGIVPEWMDLCFDVSFTPIYCRKGRTCIVHCIRDVHCIEKSQNQLDGIKDGIMIHSMQGMHTAGSARGQDETSPVVEPVNIAKLLLGEDGGKDHWVGPELSESLSQDCDEYNLPRRRLVSGCICRSKFSSPVEAMNRLAVIYLKSCHPSGKHTIELLPPARIRKHLFAVNIQCVFRGYVARRWYRTYKAHVETRLQTSFSDVRKKMSGDMAPGYLVESGLSDSKLGLSRQASFQSAAEGSVQDAATPLLGWQESFYSMASTDKDETQDEIGTELLLRLQAQSLSVAGLPNMTVKEAADAKVIGMLSRAEKDMRKSEWEKKMQKELVSKQKMGLEAKTRNTLLTSLRRDAMNSQSWGIPIRVIKSQIAELRKARKEQGIQELKRMNTAQKEAHQEVMRNVKEYENERRMRAREDKEKHRETGIDMLEINSRMNSRAPSAAGTRPGTSNSTRLKLAVNDAVLRPQSRASNASENGGAIDLVWSMFEQNQSSDIPSRPATSGVVGRKSPSKFSRSRSSGAAAMKPGFESTFSSSLTKISRTMELAALDQDMARREMSKSEQIAIQKERHRIAKGRVRSEQERHRQEKQRYVDDLKIKTLNERMHQQIMWENELETYYAHRPRTGTSMGDVSVDASSLLTGKDIMTYLDYPWDLPSSSPGPEPPGSRPGTAQSAAGLAAMGSGVRLRIGVSGNGAETGGYADVLTLGEKEQVDYNWKQHGQRSQSSNSRMRAGRASGLEQGPVMAVPQELPPDQAAMSQNWGQEGTSVAPRDTAMLNIDDLVASPGQFLMDSQKSYEYGSDSLSNRIPNVPLDCFLPSGQHFSAKVDMIAGSSQEKEATNLRLNEIGPTGERWKQKVVACQNSPQWAPKARRAKERSEATGSTVAAERAKSSASTGPTTEKKLPALERK